MRIATVFSVILVCVCGAGAEKINLESYASGFDTVPVAILPFTSKNAIVLRHSEPWNILANDLSFFGRFVVTRTPGVDTALFRKNRIGIYIDGEYEVVKDSIMIDCYLRDAGSGELVVGKKFNGLFSMIRPMMHRYGNRVIEMLFAEKGYFETVIAFVKNQGAVKELFCIDFDGEKERQISHSATVTLFPAFADPATLLCTSFMRGKPDIYSIPLDGGIMHPLVTSRFVQTSPDACRIEDKIVFCSSREGNMEIYTADIDGKNIKRISFDKATDTSPCFSPNGYQIAFTSDRAGAPQIFIMDGDGANVRRVSFSVSYADSPAWSPTGELIAFTGQNNGKFDIWVVNPDASAARQVTTLGGDNENPNWSPDGSRLVFASSVGNKSDLYSVLCDGSGLKRLTNSNKAKMPCWQPLAQ